MRLFVVMALVSATSIVEAQSSECSRARERAAPVVSATSGLLVGGAGHFTACEPRTGRRLLATEGIGLGAFVVGGGGIALTGASRRTIGPFAALTILGFGTYLTGWLSDIYGTISRGGNAGRPGRSATFELALGYRWVYDPQFDYRNALRVDGQAWLRNTRLFGRAWLMLDDDNQRFTLGLGQRLVGSDRGTSFGLESALHHHRFGSDHFRSLTVDLQMRGRLDLSVVGASLAGSFVEADVGVALQGFGYRATGDGFEDWTGMLLARVGYGLFLGSSGELVFYYDHRRDDYAGGYSMDSVAAGAIGHVGLTGRGFFRDGSWGLAGEVEYGSAWILGLSVVYRAKERSEGESS